MSTGRRVVMTVMCCVLVAAVAECGVVPAAPTAKVAVGRLLREEAGAVTVTLRSTTPVSETRPTYASWNIDSSCNRGFHHINFTNPNLLAAATGLAPSTLRFGGSGNDNLVYGLSPNSPECKGIPPPSADCHYITPGCLNATHWDNLHALAVHSNSDFLFGVAFGLAAACEKGSSYQWDPANAKVLLEYITAHGQKVWGFELGNEVNNNGGKPCNLTAGQQAAAMIEFKKMLSQALPDTVLVGPDTGGRQPLPWLEALLPLLPPGTLHAVTHHVYNGIKQSSFNSAQQLDNSRSEIKWYTDVCKAKAPEAEVWAGENGPTGGGDDGTCGAGSVCGQYGSTLWYADDLGTRARAGFAQYQRQDLIGGAYGLTGSKGAEDFGPRLGPRDPLVIRPDYWVNFLWKRLVGTQVLDVTSSSAGLRAYGFRGAPPSPHAVGECAKATVQLVLINLSEDKGITVTLPPASTGAIFTQYTLSPPMEGPFASTAVLNNVLLPQTIDVTERDPASFLATIPAPPTIGAVASGVSVPSLGVSFICY